MPGTPERARCPHIALQRGGQGRRAWLPLGRCEALRPPPPWIWGPPRPPCPREPQRSGAGQGAPVNVHVQPDRVTGQGAGPLRPGSALPLYRPCRGPHLGPPGEAVGQGAREPEPGRGGPRRRGSPAGTKSRRPGPHWRELTGRIGWRRACKRHGADTSFLPPGKRSSPTVAWGGRAAGGPESWGVLGQDGQPASSAGYPRWSQGPPSPRQTGVRAPRRVRWDGVGRGVWALWEPPGRCGGGVSGRPPRMLWTH